MNPSSLFDTFYLACPMCMSGSKGEGMMAANLAIGFMLVILVAVLASFGVFMVYLAKRAKRFAEEENTAVPSR